MKYFLTGATGFVGGYLAKLLISKGHQVIALVRSPSKAAELKALGVSLVQGDVTDKESMRAPMTGVDGVFHVAGWYKLGLKNDDQGVKINIDGTRNVLELMQELKIPKGVYTSTLAINSSTGGKKVDETFRFDGKHLSEYDRTKAAAHDIAMQKIKEGLPLVIVMPGIIYGPGDTSSLRDSILKFLDGKLPMIPTTTEYSWAHVEDIAEAHRLAMEMGKSGETYIICGPSHKLTEGMQIIADAAGKKAPMKVPARWLRTMSKLVKPFDNVMPQDYTSEYLRVMGGSTYTGDNSKASRELGYNPRPLEVGMKETIEYELNLRKGK